MYSQIGAIELTQEVTNTKESFPIETLCSQSHNAKYGYMRVDGVPIASVEMQQGEVLKHSQELCQVALDSFLKSGKKFNSISSESMCDQEFTIDLLDNAKAELYNQFGCLHFVVKSKNTSDKPFKFNVWDRDLCEQVYNHLLKSKNFNMSYEEYIMTYG